MGAPLLLAATCGFFILLVLFGSLLVEQRAMGYGWGPAGFTCLSKATPRMETLIEDNNEQLQCKAISMM